MVGSAVNQPGQEGCEPGAAGPSLPLRRQNGEDPWAMKSLHEPVVVGLAGMEPEWPGTGVAGMGPIKKCRNMQYHAKNMQLKAEIWTAYLF